MEDRARLSRWLYMILESVGASERLRRLHRQTAITREIHETIYLSLQGGYLMNSYNVGSSYEGSVTPALASDHDIILCLSHMHVLSDASSLPPGLSYLIVRDSWTYPGYVKLQRVENGQPLCGHHMLPSEDYGVDHLDRICLKHIDVGNMHGPAIMGLVNEVHVLDTVPALRCDDIPQCELEWIARPRPYEWPSRDQLQAMSIMGFMVVGVGHVNSGEKEFEWRMSYTLQERMLMTNLNPVQHKVYILLKMFKKSILGNIIHEETLTSYHFKTCVLYAVQMSPARVWTQNNLINCLVFCLKLMIKWLETKYCPSYLTQYQNLFIKEGFSRLRKGLLKVMHKLIASGHQFLCMLQCDNVGAILRNGDWRMYREVTSDEKNDYVYKLKHLSAALICSRATHILRFMSNDRYDPFTLTLVLEYLQNARHINKHTVEVIQSAMVHLFPWLHLHIANGLISFTHTWPYRAVRERVMKLVDLHLHQAKGIDLMNERLAVASVLYTFEKNEECFLLLHLVESDFTYEVTLLCPCTGTNTTTYRDIQDKHARSKKIANMSVKQYIKLMTACCVIILPSATVIAPEPLKYEMQRSLGTLPGSRNEICDFWFDWAVVDAKVYLYFLQYLVSSKLHKDLHREAARDNLRAEIYGDDLYVMADGMSRLGHKDTAYNLLGWIYMQEECVAEAYLCFNASWKIRPFHNAAKYHMRDLVVRLAERRVQH